MQPRPAPASGLLGTASVGAWPEISSARGPPSRGSSRRGAGAPLFGSVTSRPTNWSPEGTPSCTCRPMSLIETGAAPVRTCARAQLPLPSGVRDWLQVASLAVVCVASFGLRPSALLSPEFAARTTFTGLLLAMAAKARPAAPAPPRAARVSVSQKTIQNQDLSHSLIRAPLLSQWRPRQC